MKYQTKVNKFVKCIKSYEGATSPNPSILLANSKHNLNAACSEDQGAWYEAVALCGNPFSKNN
jgi:hypothetical protein